MKKKKIFLIILIGIMVSGIVLMYSSYALFSANQISKSAITIKVGTMNGTLKIDGTTTNKLTLDKGKKQTFVVTLENLNGISGKFLFYYTTTLASGVNFGYTTGTGIQIPPGTDGVILSKNGKQTYSLKVANKTSSSQTITLGSIGGLETPSLALPINGHIIPEYKGNLLTDVIIEKSNDSSKTYTTGNQGEAFVFYQEAGLQQANWTKEELTDYRYIGNNPNNYVYFNCADTSLVSTCEKWRIVGVFTVEDENGIKQKRVKLLRHETIGNYAYRLEAKADYITSQAEKILNEYYYQATSSTCYTKTNSPVTCDFTAIGLKDTAKNMIAPTKWYLGYTHATIGSGSDGKTGAVFYLAERGNTTDTSTPFALYTIDNVGMSYASDYGYTFYHGVEPNCAANLSCCGNTCDGDPSLSWMRTILNKNNTNWGWFLNGSGNGSVTQLNKVGTTSYMSPAQPREMVPTVYLHQDVITTKGTGSIDSPYELALE